MSPRKTLRSWGSSSTDVRRSVWPIRVTRGSRRILNIGPSLSLAGASRSLHLSASATIVRNFHRVKGVLWSPRRTWRWKTGPREVSRTASATARNSGASTSRPRAAPARSTSVLSAACGPCRSGGATCSSVSPATETGRTRAAAVPERSESTHSAMPPSCRPHESRRSRSSVSAGPGATSTRSASWAKALPSTVDTSSPPTGTAATTAYGWPVREVSLPTARSRPAVSPTTSTRRAGPPRPAARHRATATVTRATARPGTRAGKAVTGSGRRAVTASSTTSVPTSTSQSPSDGDRAPGRAGSRSAYRPRAARTATQTRAARAAVAQGRGAPAVCSTHQAGTPMPVRSVRARSAVRRSGPPAAGRGRGVSRGESGALHGCSSAGVRRCAAGERGRGAPASPTGPDVSLSGNSTCPMSPPATVTSPERGASADPGD